MIRRTIALAVFVMASACPQAQEPKPTAADRLVGTWLPTGKGKASEARFPCELRKDGKLTVGEGKSKLSGTYKVTEFETHIKLKITFEQDGKPLPAEEATICFLGQDRLVWYPEGEWKGVTLSRKK
jgi:uncharacterized protein (TIGR03066 family)